MNNEGDICKVKNKFIILGDGNLIEVSEQILDVCESIIKLN